MSWNLSQVLRIPLLDSPFTVEELDKAVNEMNTNRSYVGICPGLIKVLPVNWFMFLLNVLNFIFLNVCYPVAWGFSKLFVLFKSGDRLDCGNYRGISVINTSAKFIFCY